MNASQDESPSHRRRWATLGKWLLGILLIAAAAAFLWMRRGDLAGVGDHLQQPSPVLLLALLLSLLGNLFFTSWLYLLLTRPYARAIPLSLARMCQLIAASALLNYLPLRAGLIGRVAYQKAFLGIAVADTTKTVIQATALSGVCAGALVLAAAVPSGTTVLLLAPIVLGLLAGALIRQGVWRRLSLALVLRQVDAIIWVVRYLIVFALLGREINLPGASAVAGVGMLATFVPLSSNGLGLREWAVGLTAAVLPAGWLAMATGEGATGIALAADLLNRAGELIVIIPLGILAIWLLRRGGSRI